MFLERKINQKAVMSDRSPKEIPTTPQNHHIFRCCLIAFIPFNYKQVFSTKEMRNKRMFIILSYVLDNYPQARMCYWVIGVAILGLISCPPDSISVWYQIIHNIIQKTKKTKNISTEHRQEKI